jgi:hypothetical protein
MILMTNAAMTKTQDIFKNSGVSTSLCLIPMAVLLTPDLVSVFFFFSVFCLRHDDYFLAIPKTSTAPFHLNYHLIQFSYQFDKAFLVGPVNDIELGV